MFRGGAGGVEEGVRGVDAFDVENVEVIQPLENLDGDLQIEGRRQDLNAEGEVGGLQTEAKGSARAPDGITRESAIDFSRLPDDSLIQSSQHNSEVSPSGESDDTESEAISPEEREGKLRTQFSSRSNGALQARNNDIESRGEDIDILTTAHPHEITNEDSAPPSSSCNFDGATDGTHGRKREGQPRTQFSGNENQGRADRVFKDFVDWPDYHKLKS